MKESDFTSEVGSEAIASLQGQFQLVVETLDDAVGEFFFGFEIVQEQLAMGLEVRATLLRGSRRLRATRAHQASRNFPAQLPEE